MLKRFYTGFQYDLWGLVFWCGLFLLYRLVFLGCFASNLVTVPTGEIAMALWLGLRLSLKTSGAICLLSFVLTTVPYIIWRSFPLRKAKLCFQGALVVFFTFLCATRIPYYQIFNSTFNMMLINGLYDDKGAIIETGIKQYGVLWRVPVALVCSGVLVYVLRLYFQFVPTFSYDGCKRKVVLWVGTLIFLPLLWVFVRFGGGYSYDTGINCDNAARLSSHLLNEAVLDDGQALYRVYRTQQQLAKVQEAAISPEELAEAINSFGGDNKAANIDDAFARRTLGPLLTQEPRNIVVIVGESFGLWPFLPQFQSLCLVPKCELIREKGISIDYFLPTCSGTMVALNGILTGLPYAGLYENYQLNSYTTTYKMGLGYVMRSLGYKTVFWYGGYGDWQNIEKFVKTQSFTEFRCADSFATQSRGAWGCEDAVLLAEVAKALAKQGSEKVCHVILTTSNHPPYAIDVDKAGFPRKAVRRALPEAIAPTEENLTELGHIWYTDKVIGEFVRKAELTVPESLFIITGDHSDRFTFAREQEARTRSGLSCLIYGAGVDKAWQERITHGSQIQIAGTIAQLIAPKGFTYHSLLPGMVDFQGIAFNDRYYVKKGKFQEQKEKDTGTKLRQAGQRIAAYRVRRNEE